MFGVGDFGWPFGGEAAATVTSPLDVLAAAAALGWKNIVDIIQAPKNDFIFYLLCCRHFLVDPLLHRVRQPLVPP